MLSDLGFYLINQGKIAPFELTIFNSLELNTNSVLGRVVDGITTSAQISPILSEQPLDIPESMTFTVILGRITHTRAENIVKQFQAKGIVVIPRQQQKYLVRNNEKWIIPLEYL